MNMCFCRSHRDERVFLWKLQGWILVSVEWWAWMSVCFYRRMGVCFYGSYMEECVFLWKLHGWDRVSIEKTWIILCFYENYMSEQVFLLKLYEWVCVSVEATWMNMCFYESHVYEWFVPTEGIWHWTEETSLLCESQWRSFSEHVKHWHLEASFQEYPGALGRPAKATSPPSWCQVSELCL